MYTYTYKNIIVKYAVYSILCILQVTASDG